MDKVCVSIQVKDLTKIMLKFRAKKNFVHICVIRQTSFFKEHKIMCTQRQFCNNNTLKMNELNVSIFRKGNKLSCFVN